MSVVCLSFGGSVVHHSTWLGAGRQAVQQRSVRRGSFGADDRRRTTLAINTHVCLDGLGPAGLSCNTTIGLLGEKISPTSMPIVNHMSTSKATPSLTLCYAQHPTPALTRTPGASMHVAARPNYLERAEYLAKTHATVVLRLPRPNHT